MIKVFCDVCKIEPEETDFMFEASIQELTVELLGDFPAQGKKINKRLVHICKECYRQHFAELLNGKETK